MDVPSLRFGLVAEGPTDHLVLEHLLLGLLQESAHVVVTPLEPLPPVPGGWTNVLAYCRSTRIVEALESNDLVIVQIDTDCCEETGFDVSRRDLSGRVYGSLELAKLVADRLYAEMPEPVRACVPDRVIFAVAVDAIECWLLPWFAEKQAAQGKETGCLGALNRELSRRHGFSIDAQNKDQRYYARALREVRIFKDRRLRERARPQASLGAFLDEVERRVEARMEAQAEPATRSDDTARS